MAEHKINCPVCDQHLSVPKELAGQQIDCPSCSKPMTVPAFAEVEEDDEEWVEESTPKSSKLIVGIAAGIAVLGVVAFIALGGDDSQEDEPELATPVGMTNEPPRSVPTSEITKEKDNEIEKIKNRLTKGEPLDQYNKMGYTELFIAIEANDVELVKRLLAAGANPNAPDRYGPGTNSQKTTPLFSAVEKVSKELTELLLTNGANVNHKDWAGLTTTDYALIALSGEKDPDKAEQLSDIINYLKANGGVHLNKEERSTALSNLFDSIVADPYGMGMMGMNSYGAPAFGSTNNLMGMNPLGYGMMPPGGGPFGKGPGYNFNNKGAKGGLPPGFMGGGGQLGVGGLNPFGPPEDIAELFKDDIEEINQRLTKGEPLNQYGESGYTELMVATLASDLDLAKRLLEKKANPNLKEKPMEDEEMLEGISTGRTALHMAAETQSKAMCELLYNNGALLNVKDSMGFTPLDSILFQFDPQMDPMNPFSQKKVKPKMTKKGRETIVYLRSKKAKSMTAKQRDEIMAKNDPFQQMMMPFPGMMPGMMPGYGNGQSDPFGVGIDPNNPFGAGYGMPPRSESKKRERK